jgi:hypothetical protein
MVRKWQIFLRFLENVNNYPWVEGSTLSTDRHSRWQSAREQWSSFDAASAMHKCAEALNHRKQIG